MADLVDLPFRVVPTAPILARVWDLRDTLSPDVACDVALADAIDAHTRSSGTVRSEQPIRDEGAVGDGCVDHPAEK
jgi:hypothetical protein